jgi:N utilization substance protein B
MNIENIIPIYIALAEIFYLWEKLPIKVSMNEAIELAKTYGDDSSKKIANWVLNSVLDDYEVLETEKNNHQDIKYSIFKDASL